jgi:hypothetical protein
MVEANHVSSINVGDRFQRTVEYEVQQINGPMVSIKDLTSGMSRDVTVADLQVNFSKVASPVVTFNVGQTVRDRQSGELFSIGLNGFFDHSHGTFVKSQGVFTSASFEEVNL